MGNERREQAIPLKDRHINLDEVFDTVNFSLATASLLSTMWSTAKGDMDVAAGKAIISIVLMAPGAIQYASEDIARRRKNKAGRSVDES